MISITILTTNDMANYSTLKAAIQQVIKNNGNNEITGDLLQQSLLAMVNSLGAGYQFVGVATPATNPGTPDYNVFYICGSGTYTNFGNITVNSGNIGILKYNGVWELETIDNLGAIEIGEPIDAFSDLEINDGNGNVLARFKDGGFRTKYFNSNEIFFQSRKNVVVVLFMGQSNMAGRGVTSVAWPQTAPTVIPGAGYEFRAISDPSKLYPITEPFGVAENKSGGINDGNLKTGSMVSSFVNSHFKIAHKSIIGISASVGGTSIQQWLPNGTLLPDAINRLSDCLSFLSTNEYTVDNIYMVWCQGETDGDNNTTLSDYKSRFLSMWNAMKNVGVEKCFMVRIGQYNGTGHSYDTIVDAQNELCQEQNDVIMINTELYSFKELGLMKDNLHYYQEGYNRVGTHSGGKMALFESMQSDPIMFDPKENNLFYTKNSL